MAPAKPPAIGSLKTEGGLAQLNDLLSSRSYIAGSPQATAEDLARFTEIQRVPDRQQFPHVVRWYRHIAALKAQHAGNPSWTPGAEAAAGAGESKKGRAAGKEKVQLDIDCKVRKVADIRTPLGSPLEGAGAHCLPGSEKSKEKYYITTAINYCNGWPHIGHAYEVLTADVFARFHRLLGQDVFFMTGADEHGQKIADKAKDEGLTPLQLCDRYVAGFRALNERLVSSNDFYVRTTEDRHKKVARSIWETCKKNGDIYLDRYEGWYLVREERFITDQEAEEWNFIDPGSGKPLTKMSEPSFFFRLSKYHQKVIDHIEQNEMFIQPQQYRTEILTKLKGLEMRDLSISRGNFSWGVECPEDAVDGKKHVMYVWFDALINYMSGVHGTDKKHPQSRFWPADMHIVGKDISWFHAVIWPSMLMCAGIPLPKSIVVHGFISGSDGRKMSKSFGNVVDPHEMLDMLPCDTLRWYLCRESQYGDDVKFSTESMRLMHNSELCDNLGNLVNRAVNLAGGAVPEYKKGLCELPFKLDELKASVRSAFETYRLADAAELTVRACGATNKWIADLEPWKMKDEALKEKRATALRLLLEAVYVLAHFFAPFIPIAADAIFKKVGQPPMAIPKLRDDFENLKAGSPVNTGSILFEQLDTLGSKEPEKPKEAPKAKAKPEAKPKAKAAAKGAAQPDNPDQPLFSKLDVRVGKVVKAWHHPEADRLFVEEIDVGDPEGPRQIVSGLREHYKLEEFQGRKLLAVCNMKPSKLMNVMSYGMVLCAKNPEKKVVELLSVPDECNVGDRVLPEGVPASWAPSAPEAVKKHKIWEAIAADIRTDNDKVATFGGKALVTASGKKFVAPTQANMIIG